MALFFVGFAVDVCAMRQGRLEMYWVDEVGRTGVATLKSHTRSYRVDRVLEKLTAVVWVAILAVVFAVPYHKFLLAGVLAACLAVLMFVDSRVEKRLSLEQHVRTQAGDGHPWHAIRTRVVEDDGD